jgi:fluoride ion exporter CrcB/FEX
MAIADQSARSTNRIVDLEATMPWLVAAAVYLLMIALGSRLLADPDTYSHIALGRWIMEHHAVPTTDPLSQTMRGVPWVAFEWLSQVAYAAAYGFGGWFAVASLAAIALAAAFGQLTRFMLREWQPIPTLIAVLTALVLISPHALARPHVLALPLMAIWVATLIRTVDIGRPPPWRLLPLMTFWANLHGSFTFGIAIAGVIACEALWNAQPSERLSVARQWMLFGVLALAAACLNPYGPEMIMVTFRTIALGEALTIVGEWKPQDFGQLGAFEIIMLAGFGYALHRGVKLPLLRIFMLIGTLHLGLSQSRHADLLGLLAPLFLARPIAGQFAGLAANQNASIARNSAWPVAAAGLLTIVAAGFIAARHDIAPAANITPARALQSIEIAKAEPILNDYHFGGYLDFVGIPPFIDGRAELYGRAFVLRHDDALLLRNLPDFLRLLDEYQIGATLLAPGRPAIALLDRLPEWQRVYADDVAVAHVRRAIASETKPR